MLEEDLRRIEVTLQNVQATETKPHLLHISLSNFGNLVFWLLLGPNLIVSTAMEKRETQMRKASKLRFDSFCTVRSKNNYLSFQRQNGEYCTVTLRCSQRHNKCFSQYLLKYHGNKQEILSKESMAKLCNLTNWCDLTVTNQPVHRKVTQ